MPREGESGTISLLLWAVGLQENLETNICLHTQKKEQRGGGAGLPILTEGRRRK